MVHGPPSGILRFQPGDWRAHWGGLGPRGLRLVRPNGADLRCQAVAPGGVGRPCATLGGKPPAQVHNVGLSVAAFYHAIRIGCNCVIWQYRWVGGRRAPLWVLGGSRVGVVGRAWHLGRAAFIVDQLVAIYHWCENRRCNKKGLCYDCLCRRRRVAHTPCVVSDMFRLSLVPASVWAGVGGGMLVCRVVCGAGPACCQV